MRERETEGKTCKQNREEYIYTERERERRELKRDSEIERDRGRGSTHAYVHECVNMFVCVFCRYIWYVSTFPFVLLPPLIWTPSAAVPIN